MVQRGAGGAPDGQRVAAMGQCELPLGQQRELPLDRKHCARVAPAAGDLGVQRWEVAPRARGDRDDTPWEH